MQTPSLQMLSHSHSNFLSLNHRRTSRSPAIAPLSFTGTSSLSSSPIFSLIQSLNPTKMDSARSSHFSDSNRAVAVDGLDNYEDDIDLFADVGNKLADAAGDVIRRYFRKSFDIIDKEDLSPVTIVDRAAEEAMVKIIHEHFPSHGIYGEENGWRCKEGFADFVWVLDPIDGTKSFITGTNFLANQPVFGTLIALLHKGSPILGIIDQPVLRERWIGMSGRKSTLNGQEVSVRNCSKISKAYLYTTSPHLFSRDAEVAFSRVKSKVKEPLYGCDCYAYALLASGFVVLVIESGLKPYDFLALIPVIEGAGGVITDWKGSRLCWEASSTSHASSFNVLAAGDKGVHLETIDTLNGSKLYN